MPKNRLLQEVFPRERKTTYAMFRCSPAEKASLVAAARSVGKTLAGYLRGLHEHYTGGADKRHA